EQQLGTVCSCHAAARDGAIVESPGAGVGVQSKGTPLIIQHSGNIDVGAAMLEVAQVRQGEGATEIQTPCSHLKAAFIAPAIPRQGEAPVDGGSDNASLVHESSKRQIGSRLCSDNRSPVYETRNTAETIHSYTRPERDCSTVDVAAQRPHLNRSCAVNK